MKRRILSMFSCLLISCLFLACDNTIDNGSYTDNDSENEQDNSDDNENPSMVLNIGNVFDFTGAVAVAKLDSAKHIKKIMSDGSLQNIIAANSDVNLGEVYGVYKSPLTNSNDVFIVTSSWGASFGKGKGAGRLFCIHDNGTVADILKIEPNKEFSSYFELMISSITFDVYGNLYFIAYTNGTEKSMIYKFNPFTNERIQLFEDVDNTFYHKIRFDKEGDLIFISGYELSGDFANYFLRAISVSDPKSVMNISNSLQIAPNNWAYDDENGKMYFIVNDGDKTGLFIASKDFGFTDKTFCGSYVGAAFHESFFESVRIPNNLTWNSSCLTNGSFDATKAIASIISLINPYSSTNNYLSIYRSFTKDDIDIRFDKYASSTGTLKLLATLTAGKKNEAAFNALNNSAGMAALYSLSGKDSDGNDWFENVTNQGYRHNFLADIVYVKNTNTLLVNSNEVVFDYQDYNGRKMIKGCELFGKKTNGFYTISGSQFFFNSSYNPNSKVFSYSFIPSYYNYNLTLNSTAILRDFFSYCNIPGNKEFRLSAFKDIENYTSLYSTLTDTAAINWIAENSERLSLFAEYCGQKFCTVYENGVPREVTNVDYYSFMNMLSKTCFISGTNDKAINWNCETMPSQSSVSMGINYMRFDHASHGASLFTTDSGVHYEYYNSYGSQNPFFYLVTMSYQNNKFLEYVTKLSLPAGIIVQSQKIGNKVVIQFSITNTNDSRLGNHHLYFVDLTTGQVKDCLENVPNSNSLQVVSFNVVGDFLYFSAMCGTAVENGIVNLNTKEYTPILDQRPISAIFTFN